MSEKSVHLSKNQADMFCHHIDNDDRTRGYIELSYYTNFPVAFDMMQISQFSGMVGGVAEGANNIASYNNDLYPKEGVTYFSKYVANAQKNYIKAQSKKEEGITNEGLLNAAKSAWNDFNINNEFPGNPVSASYHVKAAFDDFFLKAL